MGLTKTDLFTTEQNELANMAKALAHPARIAILEHLLKANACINSDLVAELGLAQATISQHLKELKSLGLISGTIEGVSMSYCINAERWKYFESRLNRLFQSYSPDPCNSKRC
ncbi:MULTISPECIES: metalloregulator ArsR/SmtB family transcription factor [Roseivirga]|jgi:DNA-binding transcriptional ArsR family regulator|uniref:Transcriptional regulator n=1 Tax=Roseivirga thermotolerans TaxID=1758176 RepID=A0ABQ3IAQ9_9BACT|nr:MULTISPECIES: metalloregulator ArsR/SmtB family transcription factor [Roseivirga]MEC7755555.1 metalloregulator ArsR/SmtB family transcription factor [Bacteroidota bacterium]GHE71685.1 transcriptional regulator [Roseivirga thermotolerans]|tara:strand:+ start:127 stop:465 length:339 start_codon:yes stop_codon:yes gene_type:complete